MDAWIRVIVEWVNCLEIADRSVEDLRDLQDGVFFQKLVFQLSRWNEESPESTSPTVSTKAQRDERESVSRFVKAEYPEFLESSQCGVDIPEDLYTASLLLAQCSQKAVFHRPMCINLKNETQVYIKKFLELVLPYGKSLTKETIGVAILELSDATPDTPQSTPKISRPLREFFNSPAARSAQSQRYMNDRNRDLRRLRAQLETEQFEKQDLMQDIKIQEEKIQSLQKKLQEKSQELKAMRSERLKPATPQSCRKNKRPSDMEERLKRELEQMEDVNADLALEIDKLREEHEDLTRRLVSKDRMHIALKQKFDQNERSMEALVIQLEMKNNELLDMRMNNEEMREHIREIQRSSMGEQSFEMEPIGRTRSPVLLNSSEALSTIVDIQLQEAREEAGELKSQLDAINQRLEAAMHECEDMKRLNVVLEGKAIELDAVRLSLLSTEEQLCSSTAKLASLQSEKSELNEKLTQLGVTLRCNEEFLNSAEKRRDTLESDLEAALSRTSELTIQLDTEKCRYEELQSILVNSKEESADLRRTLEELKTVLDAERSGSVELKEILAHSKKISEELESLLRSKEDLLEESSQRESSLDAELESCKLKIIELQSSLSSERSRSDELESSVSDAKGTIDTLKMKLDETVNELIETKNLKNKIEEYAKIADEKIITLRETSEKSLKKLHEQYEAKFLLQNNEAKLRETEMMKEQNRLEVTLSEEQEKLVSHVQSIAALREQISRTESELEQSNSKLYERDIAYDELKKTELELQQIKVQLEGKLSQEQNRLEVARGEKSVLEEKLAAYVQSVQDQEENIKKIKREFEETNRNQQEKIYKIQKEFEQTNESLQERNAAYAVLRENESRLQQIKVELEEKLSREQNRLEVALGEKSALEDKLASYVRSVEDLQEHIKKIEREFEETSQNQQEQIHKIQTEFEQTNESLQERNAAYAVSRENEFRLQKIKVELEEKLNQEQNRWGIARGEKSALEEKLASYVQSIGDREDHIKRIEREFEETRKNQQEQIHKIQAEFKQTNESLQDQNTANAVLRENESGLQQIKVQLENELKQQQTNLEVALEEKRILQEEIDSTKQIVRTTQETALNIANELQQVREELVANRSEKDALAEQLSSEVHSATELRKQIENLVQDLEESQRKLQDQLSANSLLREEKRQQEEERERLENELTLEREQLSAIKSEKEMWEDEANLYGRSNQDLGSKIIELKAEIQAHSKNLQEQRETIAASKNDQLELNALKGDLENQLAEKKNQLALVETQKANLEKELSSFIRNKADLIEEISALHTELESSRRDLQKLQEINENLNLKTLEASSQIDSLQRFEARSSQLTQDLESVGEECAALQAKITELSEEADRRADQIVTLENKLGEAMREKEDLTANLTERIRSSNDLLASLEERLLSSQKACAEAKHEEKSKDEALEVLRAKMELLTKEKNESELRMREVILNLQEVRLSQDSVLEVQVKALEEKSSQLEASEKELVSLKTLLESKSSELENEKLRARKTEMEFVKLKEVEEKQSIRIQELQDAVESERKNVEDWSQRCGDMKNNLEEIARVSTCLKFELNELWGSVSQACPEFPGQRPEEYRDCEGIIATAKIPDAMQSLLDDTKTIHKAIATLSDSNHKLRDNMDEIAKVSRDLKLELDALWDSVRQTCPELARPKEEISRLEDTFDNPEKTEISHTVQSFAEDAKRIRKAVSILSEANETLKEHLDGEKEIARSSASEAEKRNSELDKRIIDMENERKKRDMYLSLLVSRKKELQELLSNAVSKREAVDEELVVLTEKWNGVANEARSILTAGSSACDELKHLQISRTELDEMLISVNDRRARSLKPLLKALCRIFLWSETKLQEAQVASSIIENQSSPQCELSDEQEVLTVEIRENADIQKDLSDFRDKIESFSNLLECYETSLKAGVIKREASPEEKLQTQVEKISKERKELKDKLDAMRTRNAKLEKNMDDLRNENKKLKNDASSSIPTDVTETERLQKLTEELEKEVSTLRKENENLAKNQSTAQNDETRLKEVHNEYGLKLEKIKQKMKTAYNEQIAKLNQEQERAMKDKIEALRGQMEQQCRKYTEDIAKYKAHVTDLSSRYWDVGEKLLAETQEKQAAIQQLQELQGQQQAAHVDSSMQVPGTHGRQKTASLDRREFNVDRSTREPTARPGYRAVEVIEEETTTRSTRRRSVRSIQAMGNAFNAEDEEGEVFDSVFLADLKEGRCAPVGPDFDRLSELRMRNSMCRPHLRSSYAVETHVQPIALNEDDIKNGVTGDDIFNDSLSQSLLPGQKPKKKDRTQTSYKRPGPPTPSKNGGRLSLQGNELKSPGSRVLRERNVERRTTATPKGLKSLFGTSISKRQDENSAGTPKRRLSNIFRKQRTERN